MGAGGGGHRMSRMVKTRIRWADQNYSYKQQKGLFHDFQNKNETHLQRGEASVMLTEDSGIAEAGSPYLC